MKKKKLLSLILLALVILTTVAVFSACEDIISLEEVTIQTESETPSYEIGQFNYADFTIVARYSDGSENTVTLTESMLSEYDRMQLANPGKHTLTVAYENKTVSFSVTVTRKQIADEQDGSSVAPYLSDLHVTYDGHAHTVSVLGDVPEGATVLYPAGHSFTNAGVYPVTAIVQADGYETVTLQATVTIDKATYAFDGFSLYPDYGTENDGTPKTSFVYDGMAHGLSIAGTYPAELGEPKFTILNLDDPTATYMDGGYATDAGYYRVRAVFAGDTENYTVGNLTYECEFHISKKPISVDFLKSIRFDDVTVPYDTKPHRIDIGVTQLPEGISVGYYDENGKVFGSRTEVNEEGYTVVCKFASDNPNLEIIETKTATLRIMKVNYVNVNELYIAFEDGTIALTYDGEPHAIKVFGLNNAVTVKHFLFNGEPVTSLTDVLVDTNGKETSYEITAVFNEPSDNNHNAVEPITGVLRVMKATYNEPQYDFASQTVPYQEGVTYALSFTEVYLPVGMTTAISYFAPGNPDPIDGLPAVTCLAYGAEGFTNVLGTYTCTVSFLYNPNNYLNPPAAPLAAVEETLTVTKRVYNAAAIIKVKDTRVSYDPKVNQLTACRFDEALPAWVDQNYLVIGKLNGEGPELGKAVDAGVYCYCFRFYYFNGAEIVSADTETAELKIVGMPIYDKNYEITYNASAIIYNGTDDCLPNAALSSDVADVLAITCKYYYAEPGTEAFALKYDGAGDRLTMLADTTCADYAKRAGTHKFSFTITGKNYEPLDVDIILTINPKKITVTHAVWQVPATPIEAVYDGECHKDITVTPIEDSPDFAFVTYTSQLVSSSLITDNPGVDAGRYVYTLSFSTTSQNYYIEAEASSYFEYEVNVTSYDVRDTVGDKYYPVGFYYYVDGNPTAKAQSFSLPTVAKNYTADSPLYSYAALYGTKVSDGVYSLAVHTTAARGYSGKSMEIYHWPIGANSTDPATNAARLRIDAAYAEKSKLVLLSPDGTVTVTDGLPEVGSVAALGIKDAGQYTLLVLLESDNILYDGSHVIVFTFTVNALAVTPADPVKSGTATASAMVKGSTGVFSQIDAGLSTMSAVNVAKIDPFDDAPMFVYTTTVDGNNITANLFASASDLVKAELAARPAYIVYCNLSGSIISTNVASLSVFDFDYTKDPVNRESISGRAYTEAGIYYLFIDLGQNVTVSSANRLVYRITVNPYAVTGANAVSLKDSDNNTRTQKTARAYVTDKANVKYAYGTSSVSGVDTVENTTAYTGKKVYTYEEIYDGKRLGLTLFPTMPENLREGLRFTFTFAAYPFSGGGTALATRYVKNASTNLTIDTVTAWAGELYSTAQAKASQRTSVGLYYLFVTVESGDVLCDGDSSFVVTVKVDRDNNDTYTYTYNNQTYCLTGTSFPVCESEWGKTKEVYEYALPGGQLTSVFAAADVESVTFGKYYCMAPLDVATIGTHTLPCDILLNATRYGGYVLHVNTPILKVVSNQTLSLDSLAKLPAITKNHAGNEFVYTAKSGSTTFNDPLEDFRSAMRENLDAYDLTEDQLNYLVSDSVLYFITDWMTTADAGNTPVFHGGTTRVYPVFRIAKTSDFAKFYKFTSANASFAVTETTDAYIVSGKTSSANAYCGTVAVQKGKLYLTEGYSASWASLFESIDDFTNKTRVVERTYFFLGFYTEEGNDFIESLLNYIDAADLDTWIDDHVFLQSGSYVFYCNVTLDLGADAANYDIYINDWSLDGSSPYDASKAGGKITNTYAYSSSVYSKYVIFEVDD